MSKNKFPISIKNTILKIDINTQNECRICLENDRTKLIFPCKCKFPVHKKCLIKWIKSTCNTYPNVCEICKTEYESDFIIIVNRNEIINSNENNVVVNLNNPGKKCLKSLIVFLLLGDLYFSLNFMYFNNNILYLYILMFINFMMICIVGSFKSLYENHPENYTNIN